jgi:2-iminobutanoate/2-iminopropanoate deaminase
VTIVRLGERPSMPDGSRAPYSPMVRAGGFVFVSGQLPFDAQRRIVPGGIEEHTRQAYENVRTLLASINYDLSDIVKTVNYLASEKDFVQFNAVYTSIFAAELPARSTICTSLLMPAALEVDVIAYQGD